MTTARARELRRNASEPERRLWAILHSLRQQGHHFRRQHPIGPYYADFACVRARLVIEADGITHTEDADIAYDRRRDEHIRSHGFRVLRFWNNDIMANPDGVYRVIAEALSVLTPTPDPSPSSAGESHMSIVFDIDSIVGTGWRGRNGRGSPSDSALFAFRIPVAQVLSDGKFPYAIALPSSGGGRPRTRKLRTGLKNLAARTGDKPT